VKKLRLDLDDLAVDGFQTAAPERGGGTVRGEQGTHYTYCTCAFPTCMATCPNTCAQTCDGQQHLPVIRSPQGDGWT
jgi:hypothetical protein